MSRAWASFWLAGEWEAGNRGSIVAPPAEVGGVGTVTQPQPAPAPIIVLHLPPPRPARITGWGALITPAPLVAGRGLVSPGAIRGRGGVVAPRVALGGTAGQRLRGVGDLAAPPAVLGGGGRVWDGALTLWAAGLIDDVSRLAI